MPRRRPPALLLLLSAAGLVAASAGCGRRTVTPTVAAVDPDPSPHSAGAADGPPYHFPNDAGGALLSKVLPPTDAPDLPGAPGAAPRRPQPVAGITVQPLPPSAALAPPEPAPAERIRKPIAPRLVAEEALGLDRADPEPPQPLIFAVGDRIRLPAEDGNRPPPLPVLAQPTADRAPLDDPTEDASTAAALAAAMPQRTKPVAYFPLTLPDPFANRQALRLPLPPDDGNPRTGTVHPPKP